MKCGTLLFDQRFQFPDGSIDYKLVLVLCSFGADYLVAQATRQRNGRPIIPGCQTHVTSSFGHKNYFIKAGESWFKDDTWIRLDEIFEYNSLIFEQKLRDGVIVIKDHLPNHRMKDIIECALDSDDIDGWYLEILGGVHSSL